MQLDVRYFIFKLLANERILKEHIRLNQVKGTRYSESVSSLNQFSLEKTEWAVLKDRVR